MDSNATNATIPPPPKPDWLAYYCDYCHGTSAREEGRRLMQATLAGATQPVTQLQVRLQEERRLVDFDALRTQSKRRLSQLASEGVRYEEAAARVRRENDDLVEVARTQTLSNGQMEREVHTLAQEGRAVE